MTTWLSSKQADSAENGRPATVDTLSLPVRGMDCADCARTLEVGLRKTAGVRDANVSFGAGRVVIDIDGSVVDRARIVDRIESFGYTVPPAAAATEGLRFRLRGMDCADCAKTLEQVVGALPGVAEAKVNFGAGTLSVAAASGAAVGASDVVHAVGRAGYTASPVSEESASLLETDGARWWQDRRLQWVIFAGGLWIVATVLATVGGGPVVLVDALYAGAIASGGWPYLRVAAQSLRVRRLDMNVLMMVAAIGAAVLGQWGEGATVVVLFALGGTLQARTLERTRGAIRGLMALSPSTASRVDAQSVETTVPIQELEIGDLLRLRPGERVAADGVVVEGTSAIDQSVVTGESIPVDKLPGDECFAGTLNGPGTLLLRVTREAADSTLSRIIHLVEEAQGSKAPAQQAVDRFAAIYTPLVLVGAIALGIGGAAISGDAATWIYRALTLLVISCPCALVISTPVSIVSAIGAASRRGVLIKGGAALEEAGRARVVAMDKTGTLTIGRPDVVEMVVIPDGAPDTRSLLVAAASVEALSEHPLARAVLVKARLEGVQPKPATNFQAIPGKGSEAVVEGRRVVVGSARLAREGGLIGPEAASPHLANEMDRLAAAGLTPLFVAIERDAGGPLQALGAIAVADQPRQNAAEAVRRMREAGIEHVAILTGDTRVVAEAIARQVGADTVLAELLPHEKAEALAELRERYGPVVMVGDGVNDAPALAAADVGIAMGAAGTDVALETADIALMGDDLNGVAEALLLSRRTNLVIRQNIILSMGTKLLALALAAFGFVNLWVAVAADTGTSLVVTLNGMRLAVKRTWPWLGKNQEHKA